MISFKRVNRKESLIIGKDMLYAGGSTSSTLTFEIFSEEVSSSETKDSDCFEELSQSTGAIVVIA